MTVEFSNETIISGQIIDTIKLNRMASNCGKLDYIGNAMDTESTDTFMVFQNGRAFFLLPIA